MSTIVTSRERDIYETMWACVDAYGTNSPGAQHARLFLEMAEVPVSGDGVAANRPVVLDAGCGAGKGAVALRAAGFRPIMCDITNAGILTNADELAGIPFAEACLWRPLSPQLPFLLGGKADYAYCCDVLEHIPTGLAGLVVSRLLEVTRQAVFLSVGLASDEFGVFVGEPLHKTVESFVYWRDLLREVGELTAARDLIASGVYVVRPR